MHLPEANDEYQAFKNSTMPIALAGIEFGSKQPKWVQNDTLQLMMTTIDHLTAMLLTLQSDYAIELQRLAKYKEAPDDVLS